MKEFGRRAIMRGAAALGVGAGAAKISSVASIGDKYPPEVLRHQASLGIPINPRPTPDTVKALEQELREHHYDESANYIMTEAMRSWSPIARHLHVKHLTRENNAWYMMMQDKIMKAWEEATGPAGSLLREVSSRTD